MQLTINERAAPRVLEGLARRDELTHMYTCEMSQGYSERLRQLDRIIAAVVTVGVKWVDHA
jgi:hypothetical protein